VTEGEALALAATGWWEKASAREIASFTLRERRLCCPFSVFQEALEEALGRGVQHVELAFNWNGLEAELRGAVEPPTMQQVLDLIQPEKRVIVSLDGGA